MKNLLLFCLLCFALNSAMTQSLIYSEDFADGFPNFWFTENVISDGGLWTYCTNQGADATSACPQIWDDSQNLQGPFNSSTFENGFLVMDSDAHARSTNSAFHNSKLQTGSFDFSQNDEVWLKFEYHLGVFFNTSEKAVLEVSTDEQSWEKYNIREVLSGNNPNPAFVRWSRNAEIMILDISEFAANKETVYLRWRWGSRNEFYWAIDDIAIYDGDPSSLWLPEHDLTMTKYIANAPNYTTPASQMEPFGFLGDFINRSYLPIDNVKFRANIKFDEEELFADSIFVDAPADALVANIPFPELSPVFTKKGTYTGFYEVTSAGTDETPINNKRKFNFIISDETFAKEPGVLAGTAPDAASWMDNEPHNWSWGNVFYVPNGDGFKATGISFVVLPANNDLTYEDIIGTEINTILYEWNNLDNDDLIDENELTLVNTATYTIDGTEISDALILNTFEADSSLFLKDDTYYIPMVSFESQATAQDIRIGTYTKLEYGSMILRTQLDERRRFASALTIASETAGAPFFNTVAFGTDIVPVVRLHIDLISGTDNVIEADQHLINLFPNPTEDYFQIENKGIDLDNLKNVYLSIIGMDGKLEGFHPWGDSRTTSAPIDISHLAAGTYQVTIRSKSSALLLTKKLIVH